MTDKNNTKQGVTKRLTLGLKSPTLGLRSDEGNAAASLQRYAKRAQAVNRSGVVVVTKPSTNNASTNTTSSEVDKRIILLKQAEEAKQAEAARKAEINKRNALKEEQEAQERARVLAEEAALLEAQKPVETVEVIEEFAAETHVVAPSGDNLTINRNFILQKSRIRNLDHLNKPEQEEKVVKKDEKEVSASEEVSIGDKARKRPAIEQVDVVEKAVPVRKPDAAVKRAGKRISITQVMMMDGEEGADGARRFRSMASMKRAKEKVRRKYQEVREKEKIVRDVMIPDVISVQELASRMSEKSADVIKQLMKLGMMVTVNQSIDADIAEIVVSEFGHNFKRVTNEEIERLLINEQTDEDSELLSRPPVVTIMGHVDHGKTSLLDALRETDVVTGEAGGITQHIGAYQVAMANGKHITFLDTPGHEAFTAMRLRGAKVTDIVVLVVAADDGIMEQTVEAISHAKAANVPIIVAINKIDKHGADPYRVKTELLQHGLVAEDMGGDVMVVEVSAKQRMNLDKLEETILLQAEVLELRANPNRLAVGAVVESRIDKGRGPVATLLIQKGTLRVGDSVVAGTSFGNIRALINDKGKHIKEALPSTPVEVIGMNTVPTAGDDFLVAPNEKAAKDICEHRINLAKELKQVSNRRNTLEQLFLKSSAGSIKELPIIIKGDVHGSIEAISNSLNKLSTDEIKVRILHAAAGAIAESDVTLATASNAVIVGFNVRSNNQAKDAAKTNGVDIRYYSIIYDLVDDIKSAMSGMLSPIMKEEYLGTADIKQMFNLTKYGKVAGCYVTDGLARRNCHARLLRDNVVIYDGKIKALRRFKEDLREVKSGFECGVSFEKYEDLKVGDKIEFYEVIEEARKL